MLKRFALAAALLSAVAGLAVPSASASRNMLVGIYDEPSTIGRPDWAFPKYKALRVKVLRTNLYWGDVLGVAKNRRPVNPTNPADPAYDWSVYDRTVNQAKANGIQMVFSILWTPRWAGPRKNGPPRRMADLRNFAIAAAKRYTGSYTPIPDAKPLPSVKYWMAWNEPNNPVFLSPQFRRVGSRYVADSPRVYSQMCNAIYSAVKTVRAVQQGRMRRHRSAREQQRAQFTAVALADLLRQGDEDLAGAVRRLRPSPLLRPSLRDADFKAEGQRLDGGAAREHQRPRPRDRKQAPLDHRVRVPDPSRAALRGLVFPAGHATSPSRLRSDGGTRAST